MRKTLVFLLGLLCISFAAERMVLGELFTSTTCPPCVAGNAAVNGLVSQKDYLAVIRWHQSWPSPGNDPFYNYRPAENGARRSRFGVNSVPRFIIDGTDAGSSSGLWGTIIDDRHGLDSPLFMRVYRSFSEYTLLAGHGSGEVVVEVTNESEEELQFKLNGAHVENDIAYTGTNGDPMHDQVMLNLFPRFGYTATLGAGKTQIFSFPFDIDDTVPLLSPSFDTTGYHNTVVGNSELVYWCEQFIGGQEVYQAAKTAIEDPKPMSVTDISLVDATGDGKLEAGEMAYVHCTANNDGSSTLKDVHVMINVNSADVEVVNPVAEIGDLGAGASHVIEGEELAIQAADDYNGATFDIGCYMGSEDGSLGTGLHSIGIAENSPATELALSIPSVSASGTTLDFSGQFNLDGRVTIEMFDATGRMVSTLYAGTASELSSVRLPQTTSGLYFIKVQTPAETYINKTVLLN